MSGSTPAEIEARKSPYEITPRGAVSVATFARRVGLSENCVLAYCRKGRVFGATKHPLTKKWWICPPAKILPLRY